MPLSYIKNLERPENPFAENPEQMQNIEIIYSIFYRSTQPKKKNFLNYDELLMVCSDWHFNE